MEARAILRNYRMSDQKVRLVVDLVRGKPVDQAIAMLRNIPNKAGLPVAKLIESAAANAENNLKLDRADLFVKTIFANQGPATKRIKPAPRGRAHPIRHRTSHVTVIVDDGQVY